MAPLTVDHHLLLAGRKRQPPGQLSAGETILMTHLVAWLLTLTSGILLALGLFAKRLRSKPFWSDDGFLIASWTVIVFYSAIISVELALGVGKDTIIITTQGHLPVLLLDKFARTLALTAAAWTKTALMSSLLHLECPRFIRHLLHFLIALVNIVMAAAIISHWLRCQPLAREWDLGIDGVCWSMRTQNIVGLAAQSFSGFKDLVLIVIARHLVWTKDLGTAGKVAILGLVIMGLIASASSFTTGAIIWTLTDANFATTNIRILLSALIEPVVIIMTASAPSLRLLTQGRERPPRGSIRVVRCDVTPASFKSGAPGTTPPPRPPRPTSSQSYWADNAALLIGKNDIGARAVPSGCDTTFEVDHPLQSPEKTYHPWNRLTPLEEEEEEQEEQEKQEEEKEEERGLGGSAHYYHTTGDKERNRSSSRYSIGSFVDTYGSRALNVVQGIELISFMGGRRRNGLSAQECSPPRPEHPGPVAMQEPYGAGRRI